MRRCNLSTSRDWRGTAEVSVGSSAWSVSKRQRACVPYLILNNLFKLKINIHASMISDTHITEES